MAEETHRNSFTLKDLMVLMGIVALTLTPVSALGIEAAAFSVVLLSVCLMVWFQKFWIVGILIITVSIFSTLLPSVNSPRRPGKRSICQNNLKNFAIGILNYESHHGHFPPPFTTDDDGNPLHSWRVLILPFLEQNALFDSLDLTKPWDHPDNLKHAHRMPPFFRCPSYKPNPRNQFDAVMTSYIAIVGSNTIWNPESDGVSLNSVADGTGNTLLLIESDTNRVHWMSPLDLRFEEIVPMATNGRTNIFKSHHTGGSQAATADGCTIFVGEERTAKEVRSAATINGGEQVGPWLR